MEATKADLRAAYLARRLALTDAEWAARSLQVCQHVLDQFTFGPSDVVHLFLPIARRRELDSWPLMQALWEQNITIGVPVANFDDHSLRTARLTPDTELEAKKFGIMEPKYPEWMEDQRITWVGVPLLVVDQQGQRIGYGGGFYDRFFSRLSPHTQKIGLSLEPPIESIPEVHEYDVPLQGCVTPKGYQAF
ncbi:MAG: 5-formyltetrahydrofolate cyclo-ligase [Bacteroidota bacterium]